MHFGIDYGSKLAGTTVVCLENAGTLELHQSQKGKDADLFIRNLINLFRPEKVFIDAPLSLPAAYYGIGSDYFYRVCDRELKAMSPMFLGGLTARAIKLASSHPDVEFFETYPKALAQHLSLTGQSEDKASLDSLQGELPLEFSKRPENQHQYDAILACSG